MTWGLSSYETRFRWAVAVWCVAMAIWLSLGLLPWSVRLMGGSIWALVTVAFSLRFAWWRPRAARDVPIALMTEAVSDEVLTPDHPERTLRPKELDKLIYHLLAAGYQFQTVTEVANSPVRKSIVLTIDGGRREDLTVLLPILKKYKVKATCFATQRGESDGNFLKPLEIKELISSGLVDFGGYVAEYPEDLEQLREKIVKNRDWLTGVIGHLPKVFACAATAPEEALPILQAAGYRTILSEGRVSTLSKRGAVPVVKRLLVPRNKKSWQSYLMVTRGNYHL